MAVLYVPRSLQLRKRIIIHKIFRRKHIPCLLLSFISMCLCLVLHRAPTSRQVVAGTQSLRTVYKKKKFLSIERILSIKVICSGNWNFYYSILVVNETLQQACGMLVFQVRVG